MWKKMREGEIWEVEISEKQMFTESLGLPGGMFAKRLSLPSAVVNTPGMLSS